MHLLSNPLRIFFTCYALGAINGTPIHEQPRLEEEFASFAANHGTRAAFLNYLADDAVVFQPEPVNGKEFWSNQPEPDSLLTCHWQEAFAESKSNLSFDDGAWEWRKNKAAVEPDAHGQFVSVWKRQADNKWKIVLRITTEHPLSDRPQEKPLDPAPSPQSQPTERRPVFKTIEEADAAFAGAAREDAASAIIAAGARVVFREGERRAYGKRVAPVLSAHNGKLSLEPLGGEMSNAGTERYVYGRYALERPDKTERGHYLQIWRRMGGWVLEVDLQKKRPREEEKPAG